MTNCQELLLQSPETESLNACLHFLTCNMEIASFEVYRSSSDLHSLAAGTGSHAACTQEIDWKCGILLKEYFCSMYTSKQCIWPLYFVYLLWLIQARLD